MSYSCVYLPFYLSWVGSHAHHVMVMWVCCSPCSNQMHEILLGNFAPMLSLLLKARIYLLCLFCCRVYHLERCWQYFFTEILLKCLLNSIIWFPCLMVLTIILGQLIWLLSSALSVFGELFLVGRAGLWTCLLEELHNQPPVHLLLSWPSLLLHRRRWVKGRDYKGSGQRKMSKHLGWFSFSYLITSTPCVGLLPIALGEIWRSILANQVLPWLLGASGVRGIQDK